MYNNQNQPNNGSFGPKENTELSLQTFGYQSPDYYHQYEFQNINQTSFFQIPYQTSQSTKIDKEIKKLENQIEALEKALFEKDEIIENLLNSGAIKGEKCIVCLDKLRSHIIIPCGHFILCKSCVDIYQDKKIFNCPFCQNNIDTICKVYY